MESVPDVKFIYVYVVRRIYSMSKGQILGTSEYVVPPNIIEAFTDKQKAVQRAQELTNQPDKYPHLSKITTKKHLAVTSDNGKTVSLLDCINTFSVNK